MSNQTVYPSSKFFQVTVAIEDLLENGKTKRRKEIYLVDASDVAEAEKKAKEEMSGYLNGDWEILQNLLHQNRQFLQLLNLTFVLL